MKHISAKKVLLAAAVMICLIIFAGCRDKDGGDSKKAGSNSGENTAETESESPAESETQTEKAVIVNDKPVFLYYMDYSSDTAQRVKTYETAWTDEEDIGVFAALAVDRDDFDFIDEYGSEIDMQKETWNQSVSSSQYRIGYEVSFEVGGQKRVYTILSPEDVEKEPDLFMGDVDTDEVTGYLGIWLYDDYHQDGGFYDHVDPDEYDDDTLLTSVKLRLTPACDEVSNLRLKAFSYSNSLEFDENGHYNNDYGCEISIIGG